MTRLHNIKLASLFINLCLIDIEVKSLITINMQFDKNQMKSYIQYSKEVSKGRRHHLLPLVAAKVLQRSKAMYSFFIYKLAAAGC